LNKILADNNTIKKRTFLGLLLIALLFLFLLAVYLLVFVKYPYAILSRTFAMGLTIFSLILSILFLCGLLAIVFTIVKKRTFPPFKWFMEKTLLLLYPIVLQIGRFLHITQEKIQRSFIEVNNQLVGARPVVVKASDILLILPHCLQNDSCTYKITHNVENCRRCGNCQIADILEMMPEDVKEGLRTNGRTVSMDAPISSEEDNNMYDVMQSNDTPSPDKNLIYESLAFEIERALSTLSPREAKVLKLYFGLGMKHPFTLEEIGEELKLTRERVRQIKEKAIKRIQFTTRCRILKTYLG